MNCAEAEIMLHALLDGELDAGHAREVEAHATGCAGCAEKLTAFRAMRAAMAGADLKQKAPAALRARIEAALPAAPVSGRASAAVLPLRPSRRSFFSGFGAGAVLSGALAASLVITVFRNDQNQTIANEVTASIHQKPKTSWAMRPITTAPDSHRHARDSAASARSAPLPRR